jgi:predicted flap endonuclease-1-like 5' DNA nuclease
MSSFLWLLLYLLPLLGLTAALFGWFGWQWRGKDLQQRIADLTKQIDELQGAQKSQQAAPEPAAAPVADAPAVVEKEAPKDETSEELVALRASLQAAQTAARLREDEAAKAHESRLALETEMARLLEDLARLRADHGAVVAEHAAAVAEHNAVLAEHSAAAADHAAAVAELASLRSAPPAAEGTAAAESSGAPAKSKRKRSTTPKPKTSSTASASLREITSALERQLATHQSSLAALTQERDDWQRRINKLEGKIPADPAGLGLARRSFADSEKRLVTATTEIERLQNQTRVLHRVEAQADALSEVPDDDLTQIKGIKKVISEQLRAHGIRTWRQIAQWNDDEQRAFSELLAFKNRATREQWQEQARALHEAAHGPLA